MTKLYACLFSPAHYWGFLRTVAGLLAMQILPATALNWLAQYRELYESFLFCISGYYDQAGILGELVQEADRASVAQFMGANASAALERPQPSQPKQILTALRELVQSQLKLNNPNFGSDGWLTDDALWLISKTTADRIRAWLLQQGVTGVPDSNIRLFDEMQAYGLIIPTQEDKAVWSCEIHADSGWTPGCPLTLLRILPARIWDTPDARPAPFTGKITPVAGVANTPEPSATTADSISTSPSAIISDPLADLTFSLFAPEEESLASAPLPSEPADDVDDIPLPVAMTTGNTSGTEWTKIQKMFQKQKLHLRGDDGVNIFACEVKGPRKTRLVKGYLLDKPELIFGNSVPEDNPCLSVISNV
ncbi:TPA: TraI domain-containing protein [Salmonella enterica subsp. enterica serovar Vietnam]